MNSNFFHNLANVAQAAIGLATAILVLGGCKAAASGALDCSAIDPKYAGIAGIAVAGIAALKVGVNVARDGLGGLSKPQPPVKK